MSKPKSALMVSLYSRRLRRRMVISPPCELSLLRATLRVSVSEPRTVMSSSWVGWSSSSGGMSPPLSWSRTSCQRWALSLSEMLHGPLSRRTWPFCFTGPWQAMQCFSRKGSSFSCGRRVWGILWFWAWRVRGDNTAVSIRVMRVWSLILKLVVSYQLPVASL